MKRILIIDGHPYASGTASQLAVWYEKGAKEAGRQVKVIRLREMKFDPILHYGYKKEQLLEPALKDAQKNISWAQHVVIFSPIWWGNLPAMTKGFFDRIFLPGFAFNFEKKSLFQKKLLKGRSVNFVYTQGAPGFFSNVILGDASWRVIKNYLLKFVGFSPIKRTFFGEVGRSGAVTKMEKWEKGMFEMGQRGK